MTDQYFATMPTEEAAAEIEKRIDEFYQFIDGTGFFERVIKSFKAYFGMATNGSGVKSMELTRLGPQGEAVGVKINHYRSIAQSMLTLCTSQKPAPQPIASNSDSRSQEQASLAQGLLDYYSREKRVDRLLKLAAEHAIVFGEGYIKTEWDATAGEPYMANDDGDPIREGDLKFKNFNPIDVIRDAHKDSSADNDWITTRDFQNRYEISAKYPELAEKILALKTKSDLASQRTLKFRTDTTRSDDIPVYEFFHRKSDAVPNGRLLIMCSKDVVLYDGPLPYHDIPVRRIAPGELFGTPYGYTPMFDLLAIQEAIDALYSAVVTNQTTFGVQNIMAPSGHNVTYSQLSTGLNLITYDHELGKPEPLNLTNTPPEIFNFMRVLQDQMETLSGINSTVRGNPEASLKSGSALALVQSQAIQFSSGLQASYAQLVEDVYTDAISILRDYAKTKRVRLIVGKYNQRMLREFDGSDLEGVKAVVVDSGSALSRTAAGRMQIAQDMLNNKLIKTPEEYLSVINSGRLEPMVEGQQRELINIRKENERMDRGLAVRAIATDAHNLHIREHAAVLADPEMRDMTSPEAGARVRAVLEHIDEHIFLLKTIDPNLLSTLGEQSLAAPPPPLEEQAGGTPEKGGAETAPVPQMPTLENPPEKPSYPIQPVTGQQWDPITGGGVIPPTQ